VGAELIGTPAGRMRSMLRFGGPLILKRVRMDTAYHQRCLAEHPRLVLVLTHGGMISFLPIVAALVRSTAEHDPERRIVSTLHGGWWNLPLVRRMPAFFTSAERPYTFPELQRALETQDRLDYLALPESETSLYGSLEEVKPFRFSGFIELSIRTRTPMLLVAHKGSEHWYRQLDMSGRLFPLLEKMPRWAFDKLDFNKEVVLREITERKVVNVPLPLSRVSLDVSLELYHPEDFDRGLADEWKPRRKQVAAEADRIRARLQQLYDAL
jgi:hypothetical protein